MIKLSAHINPMNSFMKFVLPILFIALFHIMGLSQEIIGTPFVIKKGETKKSGRLQIKYLGSLRETAEGWATDGEHFEKEYFRHRFEINDSGKTYEFKETFSFKLNGLVVEIIEKNDHPEEVQITVMTEQQFSEKLLRKIEIKMSFDELSAIKTFAIGPIGYAGVTSEGENLLNRILKHEKAASYFIQMLRIGTDEAKLYALYGLRKLSKKESARYFEEFRNYSAEVRTVSGCDIGKENFSTVVNRIEKML